MIGDDPLTHEEMNRILRQKETLHSQLEVRDREYKKATKMYLDSLKREMSNFKDAGRTIDARNASIKRELDEITERYRVGIDNIRKADSLLQTEKEKLNRYILSNFTGISERMKRAMAVEGQRIDVILKEFDKPDIPTDYTGPYIAPKKGKTELVNDYADLYKNFSEFNARYIPERAREIKNIEPYHVTQHKIIIGPPSHADPPRRPPPPPPEQPRQPYYDAPPATGYYASRKPHAPLPQAVEDAPADHLSILALYKLQREPLPKADPKGKPGDPQEAEQSKPKPLEAFKLRERPNIQDGAQLSQPPSQGLMPRPAPPNSTQHNFMEDEYDEYKELSLEDPHNLAQSQR